jgi:multidrug efflux pump subunit AcrA (membrane-fusion protein)
MKTKSIIIVIAVLGLGFASMILIAKSKKPIQKAQEKMPVKYLKVKQVKNEKQNYQLNYTGRVASFRKVMLNSEVTGKIKRGDVVLKDGSRFKKGDLLFSIENNIAEAKLKSNKSNFITSLSKLLPDIEIDFPNEYPKWESFFKQLDLNKHLPNFPKFKSEKEKIYLSSNNIFSNYYNIVQEEITFEKYKIKAPFDGTFLSCNVEVGAIASPGASLAQIIRTDLMEVEVPMKINDSKSIHMGQTCKVKDHYNNSIVGKVNRISKYIDKETQMVSVYILVNNSNLMNGEYVKVGFQIASERKAIKLNREALTMGNQVYLLVSNKLKMVDAEIVHLSDDFAIVGNLENGVQVVNESLFNVKDHEKIKPIVE